MHYLSTNKTLIKKQSVKKWLSSKRCHFVKKYFYGITLLHANVQCVYIVYAKYQMASVKTRSVRVAERLALPTSDHGVASSNPAGGEILPEPKRRFIAQSLSCSTFHCLEMTEILLKGCKTLTHPSISKNSGTSWFPCACTILALTKPLLKSSVKNGQVQNAVILSKSIFMASIFFVQMSNVSTLCTQSIRMFQ